MQARSELKEALIAKILDLSESRVVEVDDVVDFLPARDEQDELIQSAALLLEPSLAAVWDNAEDDVCNDLLAR